MIPALLASLFFALSGVCGQRSTRAFGALGANCYRLALACAILGCITWAINPRSFSPTVSGWLALSGLIGFGIGDVGLYLAYARIGSRVTLLIYLCSAPVVGAISDRLWLGTRISAPEWGAVGVILAGVLATFLFPRSRANTVVRNRRKNYRTGLWFALVAGIGQGLGATVSRVADSAAAVENLDVGGFSMAFQRGFAGLCFGAVVFWIYRRSGRHRTRRLPIKNRGWWLLGAALTGPVLGVSCFQWSLIAGTPSAVVLAVTATSPLLVMPLAYWFEDDRPELRAIVGSVIAVAGVVWLCLLRWGG